MCPYTKAFYVILGSLISMGLASLFKVALNRRDRSIEIKRLSKQEKKSKQLITKHGNLEDYLDRFPEYKKLIFCDELTINSVRPLLVLSAVNLFDYENNIGVFFLLIIMSLAIAHEVYYGAAWASNWAYRILIFLFWIAFYFIQIDKFSETLIRV